MTPHNRDRAIRALAMRQDLTDAERVELEHLQADKRRALTPTPMLRRLRATTVIEWLPSWRK